MEYIDGVPIDTYCDQNHLSVNDRVRLVQEVCDTVAFAHRNLIVHRDLKPGNILVTSDQKIKLLDFGIAKLLDPSTVPHTVEVTQTYSLPMTPNYASPEQIRGESISTSSDVYSLGIVLYRVLTGTLPYRFKSIRLNDMVREFESKEPVRPSQVIVDEEGCPSGSSSRVRANEVGQLRRQLVGDLDNIVMMALRKDPERRYASVRELSIDLGRYLAGLTVRARQETAAYVMGKFVRRHKLAVCTAVTFALLLAGSTILALGQAGRIARERDHSEVERKKAQHVASFLVYLFRQADPDLYEIILLSYGGGLQTVCSDLIS